MRSSFSSVIWIGLLLQATAGALGWLQEGDMAAAMRMAARFSGRVSFLAYLTSMAVFVGWMRGKSSRSVAVEAAQAFAWVHLLHFGYLAANIRMSAITPELYKAIGGALAYAMILTHAFWVRRWPPQHAAHAVYFVYVGLIMIGTFVSRLQGEFPGSEPSAIHGVGIAVTLLAWAGFFRARRRSRKAASLAHVQG